MNAWPIAIGFTLRMETGGDPSGALTKDPDDPGGTTRWGLSQRAHPDVEVERLTREAAQGIYWDRYWQPIHGEQLAPPLAVALFDWAVHSGVRTAVHHLQQVLEVYQDGKLGPDTLAAAGKRRVPEPALRLLTERAVHQAHLVREDPKLVKYLGGWSVRLVELAWLVARLGY